MTKIYILERNEVPFYVGKTLQEIKERFYTHKDKKENSKIVEIDCVDDNEWRFWESWYIELFKSWGFKLENKNNGGGGCITHEVTKSTREKISKAHKGIKKPFSNEHKINLKKSLQNKIVPHGFGEKISKKLKGRKITWDQGNVGKPSSSIIQYTLNNILVREWNSIKEAEFYYNSFAKSNNIGACCREKQKTAYGYKWKYK